MIRARATSADGRPVIVLGLSDENVKRLTQGQPIRVTGESIGLSSVAAILVFHGGTEQGMEAMLREHGLIGKDTTIHREGKS
jgi:hypothetical protein